MDYLRLTLFTAVLLLTSAMTLNVLVDPAGIYHDQKDSPEEFARALVESKHGLWWPPDSHDERLLKKSLARYSKSADCIVVGSSRSMQISSHRPRNSLHEYCKKILNLAISGASIEDHITIAFLSLTHGKPPRIFLGVDFWVFAFGRDARWSQYKSDYFRAKDLVVGRAPEKAAQTEAAWKIKLENLISLEYTNRSIAKLARDLRTPSLPIEPAPELSESVGGKDAVLLPDGSLILSEEVLRRPRTFPQGGANYKTVGVLNQQNAIDAYRSLIAWIKAHGVEPILLLVPYHENVWKSPTAVTPNALRAVEPVVRSLARDLNVKVVGSFDPRIAGCQSGEFYDYMHPTSACLSRLGATNPPAHP